MTCSNIQQRKFFFFGSDGDGTEPGGRGKISQGALVAKIYMMMFKQQEKQNRSSYAQKKLTFISFSTGFYLNHVQKS